MEEKGQEQLNMVMSVEAKQILMEGNYTIIPLIAVNAVDSIRLRMLESLMAVDGLFLDVYGRVVNDDFYKHCQSVNLLYNRAFSKLEREICTAACSIFNRANCPGHHCPLHLSEHTEGILRVNPKLNPSDEISRTSAPSYNSYGPCFEYIINLGSEMLHLQVQTMEPKNHENPDTGFKEVQVMIEPGSMILFRSGSNIKQTKHTEMQLEGIVQPLAYHKVCDDPLLRWDSVLGGLVRIKPCRS